MIIIVIITFRINCHESPQKSEVGERPRGVDGKFLRELRRNG